MKIVC